MIDVGAKAERVPVYLGSLEERWDGWWNRRPSHFLSVLVDGEIELQENSAGEVVA